MSSRQSITAALLASQEGMPGALDDLFELVYPELRLIARRQLSRGRPDGHVLDTSGLVHEAYFKLVDQTQVGWHDRHHFFGIAARAMRQVIVDYARARQRLKRGAGRPDLNLDEHQIAIDTHLEQILALNEALERLEAVEPRLLQIVECRYFAGFTEEERGSALCLHAHCRARLADSQGLASQRHARNRGGSTTLAHARLVGIRTAPVV